MANLFYSVLRMEKSWDKELRDALNSSLFRFITEKTTFGWFEDCDNGEEKDEESHAEVRTASSGEPCSGEEDFRLPERAEEIAEEEWGMEDLETVFQTRNTSFR